MYLGLTNDVRPRHLLARLRLRGGRIDGLKRRVDVAQRAVILFLSASGVTAREEVRSPERDVTHAKSLGHLIKKIAHGITCWFAQISEM